MTDFTGLFKKTVQTPHGAGKVENVYITELGYVMLKVKVKKDGHLKYINYNIGVLQKTENTDDVFFN